MSAARRARPMSAGSYRSASAAGRSGSSSSSEAREQIGVGVIDISLTDPGSGDTGAMMEKLELFGKKVLPHIREV